MQRTQWPQESPQQSRVPPGDVEQTSVVMREVKIEQVYEPGLSMSRDGNNLVYPKTKDGKTNLVVRDLVSGEETQITKTGGARFPVFSPDGKKVAYSLYQSLHNQKIHVVSLQTGEDRDLEQTGFPKEWSNERFILLNGNKLLQVSGGVAKKLDLPSTSADVRISPDGEYVSYSHQNNIYLYPVDSGDPIQITHGSQRDSQPIWSADGKTLLFLSHRVFGPEADLCRVSVVDKKTGSEVEVIKPDIGDNVTLGSLSEKGRLLFNQRRSEDYVYVIPIDPQTDQPTGEPVKLASGYVSMWSPDDKRIAYISGAVLHVMSADGSNDQEIITVSPFKGTHAWAPDNDHIYVAESRKTGKGVYSISVSTKERQPVFLDPNMWGHLTCSPDGKRLAFLKLSKLSASGREEVEIFTVNVDGTNLEQLTFSENEIVLYPAWSPDGKQIAFESGPKGGIKTLTVVSVNDGTTREVFRGDTPQDRFWWVSWSADGSKIAWCTSREIRIGQVSDGKSHTFKIDLGALPKPQLGMPHWSSDGTKMLFSTYSEFWCVMLMDNFLPAGE